MTTSAVRWVAVCFVYFGLLFAARSRVLWAAPPAGVAAAGIRPGKLTTEMRHEPLGIDQPHPRFGWALDAVNPDAHGLLQSGYRIRVATGAARLAAGTGDAWDTGRVAAATYWQIRYAGKPLHSGATYYWQVQVWDGGGKRSAWSKPAGFTTALLAASDWSAHWIAGRPAHQPAHQPGTPESAHQPAHQPGAPESAHEPGTPEPAPSSATGALPIFRRDFIVHKPVKQALLFVTGLGQYEVRLNGKNVTATVLNPAWTDYRRTVPYATYDVAALLKPGANAFGLLLGNGMYNVEDTPGRYAKFTGSMGAPACLLQMELQYADGSMERIVSDGRWQMHAGPIVFSSTYGGEDYDATREQPGWDRPGFAQADWQPALEVAGPGGTLRAEQSRPLRVADRTSPVTITIPAPGVTVYDLGANMSGWPAIRVQGEAGGSVQLLPGELLDARGRVTQRSAHAFPDAPVLFRYTLRGGGLRGDGMHGGGLVETWHPRFSSYGFRYVEVTTAPARPGAPIPRVLSLTGEFIHADAPLAGTFTSSDPLFDRIHTLIDRAVLSNLVSVLTDCPTREKLGWLEQTYLNASTLMFNYDVAGLYEKMTRDMIDAQQPNGLIPSIAPEYTAFVDEQGHDTDFRDSPEWGSAVILSPWALYQFTGDTLPLEQGYPAMQRYLQHLRSRSQAHLLSYGLGDWFDIGPAPPGVSQLTSKSVTATATFYEDLRVMSHIAILLGHEDDSTAYLREAGAVREAFNAKFFDPATGRYDRGSQTAQAMPLALGMVPAGHEAAVLQLLEEQVHQHADHVTAGDVGFHYVVRALTDAGRSAVLAAMLARTDSPSYGYQLAQGATTLTEAWDTNPEDSQNHFMLGHGEEWFYRGLAGITIDMSRGPAGAISLRPGVVAGVHSAAAEYRTAMGLVRSSWQRDRQGRPTFSVSIPPGAEATLLLPYPAAAGVPGVRATRSPGDGTTELRLGSGHYRFPPTR